MGIVSYTAETLPPVSKKEWGRIDAVKDEDINYSDIPEVKDLSGLRPRQVRDLNTKQEKVPFSCNLNVHSIKDAQGIFKDLKGIDTTIERDKEDRV